MNDSNTDLPTPVAAVDHVPLPGDNPGDNPTPRRLLVVGNPPFVWRAALAQAVMDWYETLDGEPVRLVITDDPAGVMVAELTRSGGRTTHEIHHAQPGRNPRRKLHRVMTADRFDHAIVFRYNADEDTTAWIDFLRDLHLERETNLMSNFTTTLIQLDVIR
jgi:hypothetical protein